MTMFFSLVTDSLKCNLLSGVYKYFSIKFKGESGVVTNIYGHNGDGKTLSLKILAKIFSKMHLDPILDIEIKDSEIYITNIDPDHAKSFYAYQNPLHNFDSTASVGDNIRAWLHRKHSYDDATIAEILELFRRFSSKISIGPNELKRTPRELSSGQLQFIAVAIRALAKPDFVFLDEPFSRLSRGNRRLLKELLSTISSSTNIFLTTLPTEKLSLEHSNHVNIRSDRADHITARQIHREASTELPECLFLHDYDGNDLLPIRVNTNKLCFHSLRNQKILSGLLDIYVNNQSLLTTTIELHEGINFLFGDNGTGKTLVSKCLSKEIPWKGTILSYFKNLCFYSNNLEMKNFFKQKYSAFYLPPEPVYISEPTISGEMKHMMDDAARIFLEEICEEYTIDVNEDITIYPYSIQKIVQFCIIPPFVDIVVLDEIFGSLDQRMASKLVNFIYEKTSNGHWKICLITSNFPEYLVRVE